MPETVSVLIGTRNRPQSLRRCVESVYEQSYDDIEILILDNSPESNTCNELHSFLDDPRVDCTHINEGYGVAKSRNWLMERASGEIFVTIDDDAVFEDEDAIRRVVAGFESDIGIQAFKIVDHPENNEERIIAPVPQAHTDAVDLDEAFDTSYYVGGGHAIKREVIERCGDYFDGLVYGGEELDLSYRAVDAGYSIKYNPGVVVHHYPEPSMIDGDNTGSSEIFYRVQNRLYLAYRYLPAKYLPTYLSVWLGYFGVQALKNREVGEYLHGVQSGLKVCSEVDRAPIEKDAAGYINQHHGRLWY